jgi:hypothetical protein
VSLRRLLLLALAALLLPACGGAREAADPDAERLDEHPEGRRTLVITPPEPGAEFFVYPAVVFEIDVRSGTTLPDGRRPVELILRGSLPDACTELHDVRQEQFGQFITVDFEMRRPKGGLCPRVVRPYRFYYELAEPLPLGPYTLRLNGSVRPFEVLPERPANG